RYVVIGHHGQPTPEGVTWTPELARRQALKVLGNPIAATQPPINTTLTFKEVSDLFVTKHGAKIKASTLAEYKTLLNLHLNPTFGAKRLINITRADVSAFHISMNDTPRAANHALSVMSKLMSWAEDEGYKPEGTANPCQRVQRYKEVKRERYLTPDELGCLGAALHQAEVEHLTGPYIIAAIRLLIFTGCRLSEILTLKWKHIDLSRKLIFLHDSKTGKKTVALNDAAIAILADLPRFQNNPYVIVGHRYGSHLVNLHKPWQDIRALAGLEGVRLHDLRHTHASVAVASGGSLPIIGKILGHTQAQTTARYAHLAEGGDPVRQLTEKTGRALIKSLARKPKPAA
ncbi:MAG: site-specific integrase, partial [Hyphomicrobiaceae bacterium]|nr:site-specific integrase [Hyphomicrobiaceae bacterium]